MTKNLADKLTYIRYAQIASLFGSSAVFFCDSISQGLKIYERFQLITILIGIIAFICLRYTGLNANSRYDLSQLLEKDSEEEEESLSMMQATKQILTRPMITFVIMNFFHVYRMNFVSNFAVIICDQLISKEILSNFNRAFFYGLLNFLPQLLLIIGTPLISSLGYYRIIRASFVVSLCSATCLFILGRTNVPALMIFFLLESCMINGMFSVFNLPLTDVIESDQRNYKRSRPLSSMVYGTNALLTKPAQSLAPMITVAIFNVYGYSSKNSAKSSNELKCRPDGAPLSACTSMTPFHTGSPQQSSPRYRISLNSLTYRSGVRISGSILADGGETFRGFLIQARRVGTAERVGGFIVQNGNDARILSCDGSNSLTSMTHTNRNDKTRINFEWVASQNYGDIEFVMTIVRNYNTYWTFIKSERLRYLANQPCNPNPCSNGQCSVNGNTFRCTCFTGWTGDRCDQRINRCSPNPCVQGQCFESNNDYTCQCFSGYTGRNCDQRDFCSPNPCARGSCSRLSNGFRCNCPSGYTGNRCETRDFCSPNPCVRGSCSRMSNGFRCNCPSGYTGNRCETRDFCSPNPCRNNGECSNGANTFVCRCPATHSGTTCESPVENLCQVYNPCLPNGRCEEVDRVARTIKCVCNTGFGGDLCNQRIQSACSRQNPCDRVGGVCQDVDQTTVVCRCNAGYKGNTCNQRIELPCSEWGQNCGNGRCENIGTTNLRCVCNQNWFHRYGQVTCNTSNACEAFPSGQPCVNGQCFANGPTAFCVCNSGWTGDRCQTRR
ncbi:DgyrCDS5466 [Dimorphilus gyrociliatus]|uniref:DgyrCDS5466 n=1 Tax=Dimorphilus gyrociliatus TaxID=2664684 RepID=A0A7I8VJZ5_9ANNE|nr:DgyrCDS5466 [Dimorphilus gyrociliatus]